MVKQFLLYSVHIFVYCNVKTRLSHRQQLAFEECSRVWSQSLFVWTQYFTYSEWLLQAVKDSTTRAHRAHRSLLCPTAKLHVKKNSPWQGETASASACEGFLTFTAVNELSFISCFTVGLTIKCVTMFTITHNSLFCECLLSGNPVRPRACHHQATVQEEESIHKLSTMM